jgi:hypothetical protein
MLPLSNRESPRFEMYHYGCIVANQAKRPFFSPDIRKLLKQTDGLCLVSLFLMVELSPGNSSAGMVISIMSAFGPLTVRLIGPPWVKVIWVLSFVTKSLPRN